MVDFGQLRWNKHLTKVVSNTFATYQQAILHRGFAVFECSRKKWCSPENLGCFFTRNFSLEQIVVNEMDEMG